MEVVIVIIVVLFRCKNIFASRKSTKIFSVNKFYNETFSVLIGSLLHTSTSPIAAAYILDG